MKNGVGYLIGCLLSIILWKIDRQEIYYKLNYFLNFIFETMYYLIRLLNNLFNTDIFTKYRKTILNFSI